MQPLGEQKYFVPGCYVHQLRLEPVDEGAEGQATCPGGRQVRDGHGPVALRLFLAPGEKPGRPDVRI